MIHLRNTILPGLRHSGSRHLGNLHNSFNKSSTLNRTLSYHNPFGSLKYHLGPYIPTCFYAKGRTEADNTVSLWQSRIRKKINKGNHYSALDDFYTMKERGLAPSKKIYSYIADMLNEIGDIEKAREIEEEMIEQGFFDEELLADEDDIIHSNSSK